MGELSRRELLLVVGAGALAATPVRVEVAQDGTVTARTGKVELGQGARTLLTQCVAEELGVPIEKVRLVMADTAMVPDDSGTWASLTTPETVPVMREAAARARGGALTAPGEWKVLGRPAANVNGREIVTGALRYASDLAEEGMWHGKVIRPPHYQATLESFEPPPREEFPDVEVVRDGDFLAVVSADPWRTARAAGAVRARWKQQPLAALDEILASFKTGGIAPVENNQTRYPPLIRAGDVERALAGAAERFSAAYTLAPIAHVALETRAAIAAWSAGGELLVRCGKQAPFQVRAQIARALGIAESRVRVIGSPAGSAFGSKQHADVEIEAARLARVCGHPVRVHWTREEELGRAVARPAALIEIESGVDAAGRLVAWRHRNYNGGAPGLRPPYAIANQSNEYWRAPCPLRQGSYRALAATGNAFARESHIDEWAHRQGRDPLEFRLAHIEDARLRAVVERGAELFGWRGPRRGHGMACNIEKEARLALFVEIEPSGEPLVVRRVVAVGEFGAILNPLNLEHQCQGAIIQGLGGAWFERLEFAGGDQQTRRMSQYRLPRFSDIPEIRVELIDRRDIASGGAGEPPITTIAPALGAALFTATGRRRRGLPLAG